MFLKVHANTIKMISYHNSNSRIILANKKYFLSDDYFIDVVFELFHFLFVKDILISTTVAKTPLENNILQWKII